MVSCVEGGTISEPPKGLLKKFNYDGSWFQAEVILGIGWTCRDSACNVLVSKPDRRDGCDSCLETEVLAVLDDMSFADNDWESSVFKTDYWEAFQVFLKGVMAFNSFHPSVQAKAKDLISN